ncbi:biopolymer transporter ExbD [candidate division KSB1 bacterium]|nr:biopolymer transporter ExbD [candidate division KSB1 bacterium]
MRIRLEEDQTTAIDIAPLIDCVFLLIVFFLVATTFKKADFEEPPPKTEEQIVIELEEQLKVDLPDPAVSALPVTENSVLHIVIDADGTFFLEKKPVSRTQLHEKLREIATNYPDSHIMIDIDRHAESQYTIQLLDLLAYEGLRNYGIHTKQTLE